MKNYPSVSIIFPNYNGGIQPLECISSIKNLNYPKNKIEIIVVDNNSKDGSDNKINLIFQKIKKEFSNVLLIKMKKNVGFAKAVNMGIEKSIGEFVFIGNDDIVFEKNSLKKMIEYIIDHPEVGILGGKIYLKNKPKEIISAGYIMNKWTGNIHPALNPNLLKEPDWVQGCALLVSRKVLDSIGLLDTNFSLIYFEDYDLCIRTRTGGFKVVYFPNAFFWHSQSATMDKYKSNKYYQWYKNKIRFCIKNFPLPNLISILFIQTFIVSPYRLFVLRDGRFIPFIKAVYWNINHLTQTISERKIVKIQI